MRYPAALKGGVAALALIMAGGATSALAWVTPKIEEAAKPATPAVKAAIELKAHNIRKDRAADDVTSLRISELDAEVNVAGNVAQTTLTLTFANPTAERLEGDFSLQLPVGAYVTGYALDIDGRMVDGVLQSKLQAREAYEEKLRQGVDPGLAEVDDRNLFRTHVFPILPDSGRTIRITYITPIAMGGTYSLPLATADPVGKASLRVVSHLGGYAAVSVGAPAGFDVGAITQRDGADVYGFSARNKALTDDLTVRIVEAGAPMVMRHRNGETFFNMIVEAEPAGVQKVRSLRLYWDGSRSRREDDIAAEAQLVADYVDAVKPTTLDLVVFADDAPKVVHFDAPARDLVLKALKAIGYSGATRFAALDKALPGRADVCLLISDGRMTFDSFEVAKWPCRVMTITSSAAARRDVLSQLSAKNRGALVDLSAVSRDEALKQLLIRPAKLWDVEDSSGRSIDYAVTPIGQDRYRVFGPKPAGDSLKLVFGNDIVTARLPAAIAHDGIGALWGATRIDRLNATDAPDHDKVVETARHYSIATRDVSFVVLETGDDYAEAGIAPPDSAGKMVIADYIKARDELARDAKKEKADRFDDILEQWKEQKAWYAAKYMSLKEARKHLRPADPAKGDDEEDGMVVVTGVRASLDGSDDDGEAGVSPPPPRIAVMEAPAPVVPSQRDGYVSSNQVGVLPNANLSESLQRVPGVQTTRFGGRNNESSGHETSGIEIKAGEWNPDRPYLNALDAASDTEAVYRAQEKQYGDTPAFYFDVAEWMFRKGDATKAAAVARTVLDVPSADHDTRIILAGRLLRYGAYDDAIWLDERILGLTPEKPQATRNLALALIDSAESGKVSKAEVVKRYERALDLLMKVVLTPWDGDYDGIEIISLMEANRLVARLKAMGVGEGDLSERIDPRLVAMMDTDIRITLEWNTDKTDMDLWVDEPTRERVIYSHPKSLLGGRLSNDMTRGYGPEEYLLKTAPEGEYKVLANVYAADVLNRNGATNVTVRLYRDWGRPTEKMESFVIELQKGEKGTRTVGTFVRK